LQPGPRFCPRALINFNVRCLLIDINVEHENNQEAGLAVPEKVLSGGSKNNAKHGSKNNAKHGSKNNAKHGSKNNAKHNNVTIFLSEVMKHPLKKTLLENNNKRCNKE
jgi:hypothetical protein